VRGRLQLGVEVPVEKGWLLCFFSVLSDVSVVGDAFCGRKTGGLKKVMRIGKKGEKHQKDGNKSKRSIMSKGKNIAIQGIHIKLVTIDAISRFNSRSLIP